MSTYSSLIKTSNAFEKLFKTLSKVFAGLTVIFLFVGVSANAYIPTYIPGGSIDETYQKTELIIFFLSPAIITLVLSVASFVAAKCARNVRLELPAEGEKK